MRYIRELDGIRGVMALWVVFGHVTKAVPLDYGIFPHGFFSTFAVDIFIILSGFAICLLLIHKQERYPIYIFRRFMRLFPAYLFFLLISVLLIDLTSSVYAEAPSTETNEFRLLLAKTALEDYWKHLIAHLFLLHGTIPDAILPHNSYTFLGQAWSIAVFWQFYLVAPFILAFILKPRKFAAYLGAFLSAQENAGACPGGVAPPLCS